MTQRHAMFFLAVLVAASFAPGTASAYSNHNGTSSADSMLIGTATVGGVQKVVDCRTTGGTSTLVVIDATHNALQSNLNVYGLAGNDLLYVVSGTEAGSVTGCGYTISKLAYNGFAVQLDGGNGNDTIAPGDGNDTIYGDSNGACGTGDGGAGNDNLYLFLGTDTADGCDGDDTLLAGLGYLSSHMSLWGDYGADCLGTFGWVSPGSGSITVDAWDCEGGAGGGSPGDAGDEYQTDTYCSAHTGTCSNNCGSTIATCPTR